MMNSKSLFTFFIATAGFCTLAAASSLSIEKWSSDLKTELEKKNAKVSSLVNFEEIGKKYLQSTSSADKKNMDQARELFQKGKFKEALKSYEKIEKGSDYWLESVEEKSWTYHRLGDFEKALAESKTLMSEPLVQVVGSEPFFLQALTQLRICDYPGILKTTQHFKESQKARIAALENLASQGSSTESLKAIDEVKEFPITFQQIGKQASKLPRLFYKDLALQKDILKLKLSNIALSLMAEKKLNETSDFKKLQKTNLEATERIKSKLKELATIEDKQNQLMIQKLGLVEVETIQRMHADKNQNPGEFKKGQFKATTSDDLVFPDDDHPWMDELDKYQVKANVCPQDTRRKM